MTEDLTLGQLIDARRGNRSYEELARDCGGAPGAKRLQQLAKKPVRNFPDPDSIRALALGLGASVTTVVMACARSLGLTVNTGDDPTSLVIGQAAQLPAGATDAIVAVAREMLKLQAVADKATASQQPDQARRTDEEEPVEVLGSIADTSRTATEDELYAAYMRGEGGFDAVTERRFRARSEREAQEAGEMAARHGHTDLGKALDAIDRAGEGPQEEGPEGGA